MSRAGVLLDRDGTIIIDRGYVGSVDRVEFIDGAIEAIAALNEAGIPVVVGTNQAGVARGYYSIDDVHEVHKHMVAEMARHNAHIDLWLFCPYHPDGIVEGFARSSADRKPAPGMALAAAQALDLDLSVSWVVGDRSSDMGLACAVGVRPLYVGQPGAADPTVAAFPDLAAAVAYILSPDATTEPVVEGRRRFPEANNHDAAAYGDAYMAELAKAFNTINLGSVERAAEMLGWRTCATRPSSPAATGGRPRSRTICSATTSRVSGSVPT